MTNFRKGIKNIELRRNAINVSVETKRFISKNKQIEEPTGKTKGKEKKNHKPPTCVLTC